MAKKKKPCYVVTRRLLTTQFQERKIDKEMEAANKIYNMGVSYYAPILDTLMADPLFADFLSRYRDWWKSNPGLDEKNPYQDEISEWMTFLHIQEYDLHAWFGEVARKSFPQCLNSMVVQKLATNLYSGIRKVIFSSGKKLNYRKRGGTNSLEGKNNKTGIIYREKEGLVSFGKQTIKLKQVRESDHYMQEALSAGKAGYCCIVRKPFKSGYKYFLQIIMEGVAPKKFVVKPGETGQDPGISNSSFYGDIYCGFETLAKGCERYEKQVRRAVVKYERRRRMANPQNYNPDGTVKKGVRLKWRWTKGIWRALFELKDAYRQKAAHVKNYNGWLSNQIVRVTSVLRQEQMNYRAFARKAKAEAGERKAKESIVTNKKGVKKTIRKYKRKRRFGRSILRRAPGAFDKMLRDKMVRYGGKVILLDPKVTASSQTDHTTGKG